MTFLLPLLLGGKRLASALFGFLRTLHPLVLLSLVMALFAGVQTWRVGSWQKQARAEQIAHRATQANFRNAMAKAVRVATENKTRVEARQETARKDSNVRLETIRADYRSRTDSYVARMRTAQAAGRDPRRGDMPGATETSESIDGPDQSALVPVTRADLDTLVENNARLVEAQTWAKSLAD